MTKLDKLKQLDEAILDKMLSWIDTDETNRLPELTNAISYLKANAVVEEKKQDDDATAIRKKKLEEAKSRREKS